MDKLNLHDPVFATYAVAATLMIFKGVAMSWLTVVRMMQENGGFRAPEDIPALARVATRPGRNTARRMTGPAGAAKPAACSAGGTNTSCCWARPRPG